MPASEPTPLARLGRAIDVYLAQEGSTDAADRARVLRENADLRDLLEPLLDAPADGAGTGAHVAGRELGDFRLVREIGRGGMGVVFEAMQKSLDRLVALKVLEAHVTRHPLSVARFRREAMTVGRLRHPGIVEVYAVGGEGDTHYFAMELVEGSSLQQIVAREGAATPADVARSIEIGAQVCDALGYAHGNGVVHRDVKPSNILVRHNGEAVLTDFGLAREEDLPALTATGGFAGTPHYVSPEQASGGRRPVDHRTDLFSLGATLYEMLTGRHAFPGASVPLILAAILERDPVDPRRHNPLVSRDLAAVLMKALEKQPDRRYQSAAQMQRDLRSVLYDEPVSARPPSAVARVRRSVQREPLRAALVLVLIVTVPCIALLLGYLLASRGQIRAGAEHERQARLERLLGDADVALMDGSTKVADRLTAAALELDPCSPEACQARTHLMLGLGKGEETVAWLRARVAGGLDARAGQWLEVYAWNELGRSEEAERLRSSLPPPATATEIYLQGCIEGARSRRSASEAPIVEAARLFRRAFALSPFPRRLYLARWAFAVAGTGDAAAIADCVAGLVAHVPDSPQRSFWVGLATSRSDPRGSVAAFEDAVARGLDSPIVHASLGMGYLDLGRAEDAKRALARAVDGDTERVMRPDMRGMCALYAGRPEMARDELQRALAAGQENGRVRNLLGSALEQLGDRAAAEAEYRRAVELMPGYAAALGNLCSLLMGSGALEDAKPLLERYVRENPRQAPGHQNLASVLARTGHPEEALAEYERLLELEPAHRVALPQKARMLAALGRADAAVAWLRARLAEDERLVPAWECLAELLLADQLPANGSEPAVRDPEAALRAAGRAVDLTSGPAQSNPLALRARARFATGDAEGAAADAQKAILALGDGADEPVVKKRRELRSALRRYRGG